MHNLEVTLLPFQIGRFRLEDPGADDARNRTAGVRLREYVDEPMGLWDPCSSYPEHDISVFRLELHEAGEIVGTFMPYACETLGREDDVRHISAMIAPVLDAELASDAWMQDIATLMVGFLENDLECDDGSYLSVDEWRFPLEARGDNPDQEWFGARSDKQGRLPAFIAEMALQGITIELDGRGVPDRAILGGGDG